MAITGQMIKAPIQGENLTVNSKNYAWHRPPQYPEFDRAFEYFVDDAIANERRLTAGMTLVMGGVPATAAVSSLLITMVKDGRISPDMSLLLAGPAFKVFTRMLDLAGVDYLSGFETTQETADFYRKMEEEGVTSPSKPLPKEIQKEAQELAEQVDEALDIPSGGLMGAKPKDEELVDMDLSPEPTNLIEQEEDNGTR